MRCSSRDVVGMQELASHGKPEALRNRTGCASCFYDAWIPGSASQGGNLPILWRKDRFHVVKNKKGRPMRFAYRVHGAENVEPGAGGSRTTTKYITYVLLRDKQTRRSFWVMNAHALPSVEGACGHPNGKTRRLALYQRMMTAFEDRIAHKKRPVFVTGDYNVNYRCDRNVKHHRFPVEELPQRHAQGAQQLGVARARGPRAPVDRHPQATRGWPPPHRLRLRQGARGGRLPGHGHLGVPALRLRSRARPGDVPADGALRRAASRSTRPRRRSCQRELPAARL